MCAPQLFRIDCPDRPAAERPYTHKRNLSAFLKESCVSHRCLRSLSFFVLALSVAALPAGAAELLFPKSLHLTRCVHDSIGGATTDVEQYCYGNRVILVSRKATTITHVAQRRITEITL